MSPWLRGISVVVYTCLGWVSDGTSTTTSDLIGISLDSSASTADPEEFMSILEDIAYSSHEVTSEEESDDESSLWPFEGPVVATLPSGELDASTFRNVVVIPDIHGDKDSFMKSLWIAFRDVEQEYIELTDFTKHIHLFLGPSRAGRKPLSDFPAHTVMIQLGDVVDRGPDGLACLHILDVVEAALGWRLVRLYGNHEFMSHRGRSGPYIHPQEDITFTHFFKSSSARIDQFAAGSALWSRISASSLLMARINTGSRETNSASALFVHGGVDLHWIDIVLESYGLSVGKSSVDILNELTFQTVSSGDPLLSIESFEARLSPIWTRDLAELNQRYVCLHLLPRVLKYFNVARLIVGHTPQHDREMKSLCRSRLILADAAMSQWMVGGPGNPAALIMKQSNGELTSLKAVYLDGKLAMMTHNFFDIITGPKEYKPTKARRLPVKYSSTSTGSRDLHSIRYEFQGMAQEMAGERAHAFMEHLMYERPVVAIGVPRVVYVSPLSDISEGLKFHAVLDTHGVSLRTVPDITAAIRRQIYDILFSMWTAGYVVEHQSAALLGADPRQVLDLFVMDVATGLVQLVDFSLVKPRAEWSVLDRTLGGFAADLHMIKSPLEHLEEWRLMLEIFNRSDVNVPLIQLDYLLAAEDVAPFTAAPPPPYVEAAKIFSRRVSLADLFPGGGMLPPPAVAAKPADGVTSPPGAAAAEVDDMLSLFTIIDDDWTDLPIETVWNITHLGVMFHSDSIDVFRGDFANISPVTRSRATVVHTPKSEWRVINWLLTTGAARNGLPPMLASADRMDGSRYFALDMDPRYVGPLRDVLNTPLIPTEVQIVEDIIQIVTDLHGVGVVLNLDLENVKDDICRRFFVDVHTQHAYLFDVAKLGQTMRGHVEAFEDEIALVLAALRTLFPKVSIQDTASAAATRPPGILILDGESP